MATEVIEEIHIAIAPAEILKCDFCSESNVTWRYKARSYQLQSLGSLEPVRLASTEDWGACDTCHGLIGRGDWHGLAERSAKLLLKSMPLPLTLETVTKSIAAMHQEFRANWLGPAVKVESKNDRQS